MCIGVLRCFYRDLYKFKKNLSRAAGLRGMVRILFK